MLAAPAPSVGFGGWFSTALNVVGSIVGEPGLGNQVAAQASPGYAPITQDPSGIARTIAPSVVAALKAPPADPKSIGPQAGQVAQAALQATAQELTAQGYVFAPGTLGAQYQSPSILNAFGGGTASLVEIGAGVLGLMLLVKLVRR
jgi:hypothetical protein